MSAPLLRCLVCAVVLWTTAGFAVRDCLASRIEAVSGKDYRLAKQHGPWMIMVATFHSTASEDEANSGKSPASAAADLVIDLRKAGLPAYVHVVENEPEVITTRDRLGQEVKRRNGRRIKSHCVLAGNYPSIDNKVAQETLDWVKGFDPKSMQDVYYVTKPGKPLPLSGSFLCINPLVKAEEVADTRTDPLIKQINSGTMHSLADCKGEYTLVVATFGGKQFTQLRQKRKAEDFEVDNNLNRAGATANELAIALRQDLDAQKQFRNLDAYVWHDFNESIVTVGSFKSENDPAIQQYMKLFSPALNPETRRVESRYLAIQGSHPKVWAFTSAPYVIRVPRIK